MNKDLDNKLDSVIVARINAVRMSEWERSAAFGALRDADSLVDAFAWLAKKIEQMGERLFLRPSLKH